VSALSPTPLPKGAGEGLLLQFGNMDGYLFEGFFEILQNGLIWESKDSVTSSPPKLFSNSIIGFGIRRVVDTAIKFNNQSETRRTKICNITPNRFLTLKLHAIKSLTPERCPQNRLSRSLLLPILSSQLRNVSPRHKSTLPKKAPLPRFSGEGLGRGCFTHE
jgi:hypothetical protein